MLPRSPLHIQADVISAIFHQNIRRKVSGYALGIAWLLVEPLLMVAFFILMFGMRGRGAFGYAEPAVFVLTGILTFRLFFLGLSIAGQGGLAPSPLLTYRQVTMIDIVLANALLEYFINFVVTGFAILFLWWIGFNSIPDDLLPVVFSMFLMGVFGLIYGMLAAVWGRKAPEIKMFFGLVRMPLLFLSAVFYPMTSIPEPYRTYLAYNPLVHVIEWGREAWIKNYVSPVVDLSYVSYWVIIGVFLAFAQYRLHWRELIEKK